MSIDIGWGSSATAIMVSRFVNGKVQIVYSKEFANRPLFQDILDEIWRLKRKCNGNLKNILMDASATELYTALCHEFNQNPSLQYLKDKQAWVRKVKSDLMKYLFICPIPFNPMHKALLNHTQRMLSEKEDDGTAIVGIHEQFEDLITSCRSAYASDIDVLDKERTVHADTFDALRMNLSYYKGVVNRMKKLKHDDKKSVISSEQFEGKDNKVYLCSWCSCQLSKLIDSSGQNPSLYCSRCQMSLILSMII